MIEIDLAWLLALPVLFALGWLTAKLERSQSQASIENPVVSALEDGLLSLVDGDRPSAVTELLALVKLRPDQLALQVAIGRLLREIGQVDRAIDVHLAVLTRLDIATEIKEKALFEIALDYKAAGIIDRAAESNTLLIGTSFDRQAREALLDLFQRQRLWSEALSVAEDLLLIHSAQVPASLVEQWILTRFHLLCELGQIDSAKKLLPMHPRLSTVTPAKAKTDPYQRDESLKVCSSCGYYSREVNWQCPSCFSWDTMHVV